MNIPLELKKIIAEKLGVEEEEITEGASLVDDLGADSLDLVELTIALEDRYKIEISDEEAENLITVGDIVEYLENRGVTDES